MYNLVLAPSALKSLGRLERSNKKVSRRIVMVVDSLKTDPFQGKKLLGPLSDFRSLRVGEYRIIYTIIEQEVLVQVIKIAHRREVYR